MVHAEPSEKKKILMQLDFLPDRPRSLENPAYHEVLEKRKKRVGERKQDRAIIQTRKALERGLYEVFAPASLYMVLRRENLQNESVWIAVIKRLRRNLQLFEG